MYGARSALATEVNRFGSDVDPGHVTELGEVREIDAGAAAGIENREVRAAAQDASQEAHQNPTATDEPPVVLLEEEVLFVVRTLHAVLLHRSRAAQELGEFRARRCSFQLRTSPRTSLPSLP